MLAVESHWRDVWISVRIWVVSVSLNRKDEDNIHRTDDGVGISDRIREAVTLAQSSFSGLCDSLGGPLLYLSTLAIVKVQASVFYYISNFCFLWGNLCTEKVEDLLSQECLIRSDIMCHIEIYT